MKKTKVFSMIVLISSFLLAMKSANATLELNLCNIVSNGFDKEFGLQWNNYPDKLIGDNKVLEYTAQLLSKGKSYNGDVANKILNQEFYSIDQVFLKVSDSWPLLVKKLNNRIKELTFYQTELLPMSEMELSHFKFSAKGNAGYLKLQSGENKKAVILTKAGFMVLEFSDELKIINPTKDDLENDEDLEWQGDPKTRPHQYPSYTKHYENAAKFLTKGRAYNSNELKHFISHLDVYSEKQNSKELESAFYHVSDDWTLFSKKLVKEVSRLSKGEAKLTPIALSDREAKTWIPNFSKAKYFSLDYVEYNKPKKLFVVLSSKGTEIFSFY